jgi:hypothetical protein
MTAATSAAALASKSQNFHPWIFVRSFGRDRLSREEKSSWLKEMDDLFWENGCFGLDALND